MKKKLMVAGLCGVACLLLGAVAVESIDRLVIQPRTIRNFSDVYMAYLDDRENVPPTPLPLSSEEILAALESGDLSFQNKN